MNRKEEKLIRLLRKHSYHQNIFQNHHGILVAVSGGVDSCVLLDLIYYLMHELKLEVIVGHIHHQLRGNDTDMDSYFVEGLAAKYKFRFFCDKVDVRSHATKHKISIETAARELRYKALEKIASHVKASAVITAHNRNDQAETVLAKIMRGSGLRGIAGISTIRHSNTGQIEIIRPLLPFSRERIVEYANERRLNWREDKSNTDVSFSRNRIRHELLPLIEQRFNPNVTEGLCRFSPYF